MLFFVEVIVSRRCCKVESPWGAAPLTSHFDDIHDCIHVVPERIFSLTVLRILNIFGNLPLSIRKVGWISFHNFN